MTEPAAPPEISAFAPDDPRRLVLADLVAQLAAGLREREAAYAGAAGRAEGALRTALEALQRAKAAQREALAPLARALGVPDAAPASRVDGPDHWGAILGEAFQGERTLERITREVAAGVVDPPTRALMAGLAIQIARDRDAVRRLYVQYT
jgi:hypothetical protein